MSTEAAIAATWWVIAGLVVGAVRQRVYPSPAYQLRWAAAWAIGWPVLWIMESANGR
ncbi:hypothetical protein [Methylobacterium sp. WL19]|uniref:hypothetical protein n=1 Tax=Methylobacterium sp. WL19 TaxID=2603896 RepID=UPI001650C1AD|nr:hypothetical protein [Methylobacterium sp. WL19]